MSARRGLILIPAFCEEQSLGDVLDRLAAEKLGTEIVVIDDGSSDRTAAVAAGHGAGVISHAINLGYARTIQTGLRHALSRGCDYAITLDADGQHDPAHLRTLLARAAAADAPHVVIGSRFVESKRYQAPLGRRLGMIIFSTLTGLIAGRRIYDTTSGLKWMSHTAMTQVARLSAGDMHSEMIIYSLLRGLSVVEAPIVVAERRHGQSMYDALASLFYPFRTLLAILVLLVRARREGRVGHA